MSEEEAREMVGTNPDCFLRVTRPEVGLPLGSNAQGAEAYAAARSSLDGLQARGVMVQEAAEAFYLYSQKMGDHRQAGLMAICSVAEYDAGDIKRHEFTRPVKEQDRVDHILGTGAQTGLVFLAHRQDDTVAALQAAVLEQEPLFVVTTPDGVEHTLHRIDGGDDVAAWRSAFAGLSALYIADGHHRSAAASRVSKQMNGAGGSDGFLAGIFPEDQLHVMAYNRLVADLAGRDVAAFKAAVEESFELLEDVEPQPASRGVIHMFLEGRWWGLVPRPGLFDSGDAVASLDVSILQDHLLAPLLNIQDPRRDTRIRFVGGIRGPGALSDAVKAGEAAVGFSLYPTGLDQLFAVADSGQVMPPKSTWFEPKLAGGVVLHKLEE